MRLFSTRFQFLDVGPLIDGELELVPPEERWIDDLLAAAHHPLTQRDAPNESKVNLQQLRQFLKVAPRGHDPGDSHSARAPQYHFWMRVREPPIGIAAPPNFPEVRIAGAIGLRIGSGKAIEMYYGHFGYHVYPPARGHHFAERACRLLLPLARAHGIKTVWITCNPDNLASRTTCERLGAEFIEIVSVPRSDPLYARCEYEKCRYKIEV